eukprot:TRINITY_DN385_c0_g1_i1.p1 TRINITY_DN385_c0_g1~~TRINITY_DN385_c0_g1_i1.p1  ORF type:complete len:236 (+),score=23.68 TRINITY_DN385_c0_g1_i1:187-894(+)
MSSQQAWQRGRPSRQGSRKEKSPHQEQIDKVLSGECEAPEARERAPSFDLFDKLEATVSDGAREVASFFESTGDSLAKIVDQTSSVLPSFSFSDLLKTSPKASVVASPKAQSPRHERRKSWTFTQEELQGEDFDGAWAAGMSPRQGHGRRRSWQCSSEEDLAAVLHDSKSPTNGSPREKMSAQKECEVHTGACTVFTPWCRLHGGQYGRQQGHQSTLLGGTEGRAGTRRPRDLQR